MDNESRPVNYRMKLLVYSQTLSAVLEQFGNGLDNLILHFMES